MLCRRCVGTPARAAASRQALRPPSENTGYDGEFLSARNASRASQSASAPAAKAITTSLASCLAASAAAVGTAARISASKGKSAASNRRWPGGGKDAKEGEV